MQKDDKVLIRYTKIPQREKYCGMEGKVLLKDNRLGIFIKVVGDTLWFDEKQLEVINGAERTRRSAEKPVPDGVGCSTVI